MDKNMELGNRIKEIRLKLGKNQEEFGQLFSPPAPKSAVSRWEHGGSPNKKRLKSIAELGNISVDELVNGSHYKLIDDAGKYVLSVYADNFDNGFPKTKIARSILEKINSYQDVSDIDPNFVKALKILHFINKDDSYIEEPSVFKKYEFETNPSYTDSEKQEIANYYKSRVETGVRYCVANVAFENNKSGVPLKSKTRILNAFEIEAKEHFEGFSSDNHGLAEIARDGIIMSLSHLAQKAGVTYGEFKEGINAEFYKGLVKVLEDADNKIDELEIKLNAKN